MLNPITGNKHKVVAAIGNAVDAFTQNNALVQEKLTEAFPDQAQREQARQKILENLRTAYLGASQAQTDPKWFTPHNPMAGVAQSAMNARDQKALVAPAPEAGRGGTAAAPVPAAAPFERFGPLDPEWVECIVDGFKTTLEGKARFVQHQNLNDFIQAIPEVTTIALVGDWGASNATAQMVADQIRAAKPQTVIHLGDIYYAGQQDEAKKALAMWPMADPATGAIAPGTSFALNGNHEMFSGGHAYFETVLPALGQKASYFGLKNAYWQILAFDSAYVEHRLLPPDAHSEDARSSANGIGSLTR